MRKLDQVPRDQYSGSLLLSSFSKRSPPMSVRKPQTTKAGITSQFGGSGEVAYTPSPVEISTVDSGLRFQFATNGPRTVSGDEKGAPSREQLPTQSLRSKLARF